MSNSKNRKGFRAVAGLVVAAMVPALSFGAAAAQTASSRSAAEAQAASSRTIEEAQAAARQRAAQADEAARRAAAEVTYGTYVFPQSVWTAGSEASQLPQDIRIMQRIVTTALGEVTAPELPEVLRESADAQGSDSNSRSNFSGPDTVIYALARGRNRVFSIGGRDVTGFYMQGYGYLFTVKWQVAPQGVPFAREVAVERLYALNELADDARRAAAAADEAAARAAGEAAERTLQQERERLETRQVAWEEWSAQYRDVLAEALRGVVAQYGSTLNRATPEESITFIADFGGGEAETVTVSARRGALTGASREDNIAAVQMAMGESGISPTQRTELKIMAEIIDSSLQVTGGDDVVVAFGGDRVRYFGGDSSFQYVPGYGVLFRKSARLNLATQMVQRLNAERLEPGVTVHPLRQRIDETTEEQREVYAAHLTDLKQKTAEIMATYGPTLTGMGDDEWVGIYFNVGSAAGLLEGGISNFLVQARMADIRGAGNQSDGATWLLNRLVTNESQD